MGFQSYKYLLNYIHYREKKKKSLGSLDFILKENHFLSFNVSLIGI